VGTITVATRYTYYTYTHTLAHGVVYNTFRWRAGSSCPHFWKTVCGRRPFTVPCRTPVRMCAVAGKIPGVHFRTRIRHAELESARRLLGCPSNRRLNLGGGFGEWTGAFKLFGYLSVPRRFSFSLKRKGTREENVPRMELLYKSPVYPYYIFPNLVNIYQSRTNRYRVCNNVH